LRERGERRGEKMRADRRGEGLKKRLEKRLFRYVKKEGDERER